MPEIVLALVPHPDDAEFFAGGTLAKFVTEGARLIIATATDGSKGSFEHPSAELSALRAAEAESAAKALGAEQLILLGHTDFELDLLPAGQLRREFVHLIRRFQPDTVLCEDPFANGETHPDHRAVAMAAMEAINYARLPLLHPEQIAEGFPIHAVTEKYYYSEDPSRWNKVVDITTTFELKMASLAAHRSQMTFLVEGLLREMRSAGIDPANVLGEAANDPVAAMTLAMRMQAAEIGAREGFELGEPFHYERYHPLVEALLPQG